MSFLLIATLLAGLFLAYANGANDNFKGVATLFGSKTTSYRRALSWATVTTAAGSLTAVVVAQSLLGAFRGKGLVPLEIVSSPAFTLAVAAAAAATVMLATRLAFPISTTHALTGALVGAGLIATAGQVNFSKLGAGFLLPLLVSPFIALIGAAVIYPFFRGLRRRLGVTKETCVCVGEQVIAAMPGGVSAKEALAVAAPMLSVGDQASCEERYSGRVVGISATRLLDGMHFLSAGMVSFARGLNDTPKIAALLLATSALGQGGTFSALVAVGIVMAFGGLISARGVAQTMSFGVTKMNAGQGFSANLVTGLLVTVASRFGMPVSTTHVSCGSLFGIGLVTRQANGSGITKILLAWVVTLPLAMILGGAFYFLFR